MATSDVVYAAPARLPDLLERGRANQIEQPMYRNGSLVAPSSGTVSIWSASGGDDDATADIVAEAAVTVSGSIATYSVAAAALSGEQLGEGWRVRWSLVMPDGVTHVVKRNAALVRARLLHPPISELELYRVFPSLDPSGTAPISSASNFTAQLDVAWERIQRKLLKQGNRPTLIVSAEDLADVCLHVWVALIFDDLATRLDPAYAARANQARRDAGDAWAEVAFLYDSDDDGKADTPTRRRAGVATLWLNGRA